MAAIAFLIAALAGAGAGALPLTTVADVPLPGDASRFDYESYDPVRHRLVVLDLATRWVRSSFEVGSGHDVLAHDPALGLIYVASESGNLSMFKLAAGRVEKLADGLLAPNAHVVAVDPETHLVYFPIKSLNGRPVLRIMRPAP